MSGTTITPERSTLPRWVAIGLGRWGSDSRVNALAALFLMALTVAALGTTLFSRAPVFSNDHRDLALQFVHWRKFGFDELRAGHLALWNPHIYGGAPFFGGFQSALLYPPNWLYLCLPLGVAINTGIALHVLSHGVRHVPVDAGARAASPRGFVRGSNLHVSRGRCFRTSTPATCPTFVRDGLGAFHFPGH